MHLLVLRFSAIGDVALTIPVLLKFREKYPEVQLTMVAPKMYRPLIEPLGIGFIETHFKKKHKGIPGLTRLYRKIHKEVKPDMVIDLHSVLRTHILQTFFRLRGTPFFQLDKGRDEKTLLTLKKNKVLKQLPHTTNRYAQVFADAGFPLNFDPQNPLLPQYEHAEAAAFRESFNGKDLVGIAPFAGFPGKTWPLQKISKIIDSLLYQKITIVLFGGLSDIPKLEKLRAGKEHIVIMPGKFDFAGEIVFMKNMKAMISMDSSNMHLATLAGIPVVSIWGATHSFAGFGPLGKNDHLQAEISTDELSCRPCSVFGNKPCFRKDYACLNQLPGETVFQKVQLALRKG